MPSHVRVVVNHKIEKKEKQPSVHEEVKPVQMEDVFEQRQLSLFEL